MNHEERLKKVCDEFSQLTEGQQDYILGILQALVFAKSANGQPAGGQPGPGNPETAPMPS